jgi:hypothetical protein
VYWTNASAVETIPAEVVAKGETEPYVTWEYHVVHCTYMWLQMHRAYGERGYIDVHLDGWEHTRHCQEVALETGIDSSEVNTKGELSFPECRSIKLGAPVDWPLGDFFSAIKTTEE